MILRRLFHNPSIPAEYRSNFNHLYLDIGWFGVLNGSALAFLAVYATRLGASGYQIGLLGAMAAAVNLLIAMPAGQWLQRRPIGKAVFWTSLLNRLGYLLWVPLPWLFGEQGQVWALIALALLMAIPGTALAVGFNALFAEAVPAEWRAHVAGIRNVVLSVVFVATSLVCGAILDGLPFPIGYQVVFTIGFIGAAMSSYHIFHIRPLGAANPLPAASAAEPRPRLRLLDRADRAKLLRTDIWRTPFAATLLVLFGFHLAQYFAIPLFPIYFVRSLHLNDQQIGIGTATFYVTVLLGSTQLARLTRRLDHKRVTGLGVMGMAVYPMMLSLSRGFGLYLVTRRWAGSPGHWSAARRQITCSKKSHPTTGLPIWPGTISY